MTDYSTWKVGDKVVCVDAQGVEIMEGCVYTIQAFQKIPQQLYICMKYVNDPIGVHLVGIQRVGVIPFGISRFRKVQPRKTSISIFTAMLNKTGVDA